MYLNQMRPLYKFILLVLIGLIVLAGLIFAYTRSGVSLPFLSGDQDTMETGASTPISGHLFLSLIYTPNNSGSDPVPATYTEDLADDTSALTRRFTDKTDHAINQLAFSPDGQWVTFIAMNRNLRNGDSFTEADGSYAEQVFRARVGNRSLDDAIAKAEQLTNLQAAWKSLPSINNDGEVLFISRGEGTNSFDTDLSPLPSNWIVHYVETAGAVVPLTSGMYPKWLEQDGFIYLTDDGIKYRSLVTGEDTPVLSYSTLDVHQFDISFDVSNDETLLAVATPVRRSMDVFEIQKDGSQIKLDPVATFDGTPTYWPQISPDNNYVGVLELERKPGYVFYSIAGDLEVSLPEIGLEAYDNENLFVTDWR